MLCQQTLQAQDINFSYANVTTTNAGPNGSFEADVMIEASTNFKLGSGQLYFNYNPNAFGENVFINNQAIFTVPDDSYILGQKVAGTFNIYSTFVTNDNTNSRVSFSWQQDFGDLCIPLENVTTTASKLFHFRFDFIPSGVNQANDICFESTAPFDDQIFTSCVLTSGSCGTCGSGSTSGEQLVNDVFDCSSLALPLELIDFQAHTGEDFIQLNWTSYSEFNFSHYELERSVDGQIFGFLTEVESNGGDFIQNYSFDDYEVFKGQLYYYRLKMYDLGGSFLYSEIRTARLGVDNQIQIYPNPASDILNVQLGTFKANSILIRNVAGQEIKRIIPKEFLDSIEITSLEEGFYFITFIGENEEIWTEEFVKMR